MGKISIIVPDQEEDKWKAFFYKTLAMSDPKLRIYVDTLEGYPDSPIEEVARFLRKRLRREGMKNDIRAKTLQNLAVKWGLRK